jgi:hypothetical protein
LKSQYTRVKHGSTAYINLHRPRICHILQNITKYLRATPKLFFLSLEYVDSIANEIDLNKIELYAVGCISIASDYIEFAGYHVGVFADIIPSFTKKQFIDCQIDILKRLKFRLYKVTAFDILMAKEEISLEVREKSLEALSISVKSDIVKTKDNFEIVNMLS